MKAQSASLLGLVVALAVAALAGMYLAGIYAVQTGQGIVTATPTPTRTSTPMPTATRTLTPTPIYHTPLLTAQEAISKSLALFPHDHNPDGEVAILIDYATLDEWTEIPQPREDPQAPVWLVGILGSDLTVADGNPVIRWDPTVEARFGGEAEGVYYAWDANSSALVLMAALAEEDPDNYTSLLALPTADATIVAATAIIVIELPDGTPEP